MPAIGAVRALYEAGLTTRDIAVAGDARRETEVEGQTGRVQRLVVALEALSAGRRPLLVGADRRAAVDSGLAGFRYTQFTDTEQEINGLFTADREPKIPLPELRAILTRDGRR